MKKQNILGGYDSIGNVQANCGVFASWGDVSAGNYRFQLNKFQQANGVWKFTCCLNANPVRMEW